MVWAESVLVDQEWVDRSDTYNLILGGQLVKTEEEFDEMTKTRGRSLRGIKKTPEHCQNISKSKTGVSTTQCHKDACSKRQSGEGNNMYGRKHTPESIQKIKTNRRKTDGVNNSMYGVHRTGKDAPNYNRMWINNGIQRKMIIRDSPLPDGYRIGYS